MCRSEVHQNSLLLSILYFEIGSLIKQGAITAILAGSEPWDSPISIPEQ